MFGVFSPKRVRLHFDASLSMRVRILWGALTENTCKCASCELKLLLLQDESRHQFGRKWKTRFHKFTWWSCQSPQRSSKLSSSLCTPMQTWCNPKYSHFVHDQKQTSRQPFTFFVEIFLLCIFYLPALNNFPFSSTVWLEQLNVFLVVRFIETANGLFA